MWKVVIRGLRAHGMRQAATFLAVALGVAFVSGVLTMSDSMDRTLDRLFESAYQGTDAVVRSPEVVAGALGEPDTRGTIDAALVDRVREVPTVAEAGGDVAGAVQVVGPDGEPLPGAPASAGSWDTTVADPGRAEEEGVSPFDLRSGRWPERPGEVAIDAATARRADVGDLPDGEDGDGGGAGAGHPLTVETAEGAGDYRVVGVFGFGGEDDVAGAGYVLFTTDDAQRAVGRPGRVDLIGVVAEAGTSQEQVVADIEAALGDRVEVLTGEEIIEESQGEIQESLTFLTGFLLAFAVVAVVVGAFVIHNSLSIVVAQRTRELALLRAIGASRRQVRRAVVGEALVTAALGSLAGFALGLGVADLLLGLIDIPGGLAVTGRTLALALAVGVLVTLASALIPARRASRVPPLAALRDVAVDRSARSRRRIAGGLALLAVGVFGSIRSARSGDTDMVGLAVLAAAIGLLVAGPGLAVPVSTAVGWPFARLRGVSGTLARRNATRNPQRTAATAQALVIGVGIVSFFLVVDASLRTTIDRAIDASFAGDLVVDAGAAAAAGGNGLPPSVAGEVAAIPGVEAVLALRSAPAQLTPGGGEAVAAPVTAAGTGGPDVLGLDPVAGDAGVAPGTLLVSDATALNEGLAVGDRVRLDLLDAEPAELTIGGLYDADSDVTGVGGYLMHLDDLAALRPELGDARLVVGLEGDAPERVASVRRAVDAILDSHPGAEVLTADEYAEDLSAELDLFLQLVLGLLSLTVLIAVLGIANTVGLSVLERTGELGLLRAVGMSRRQVRSAIRWESVIVALHGTLLGLAVGVGGAWAVMTSYENDGAAVFRLPAWSLAALAVLAGVLGLLAALAPAWRAGRLDVLDAITQ